MENAKTLAENVRRLGPVARTGLLLLAMASLAAFAGCARETPEAALRAQLQRMQEAATRHQASDFMDGVAADFTGNGGMDRAALHNLMRAQLLGNASIGATLGPVEIEMNGDRATMRFTALLTGGQGGFIPDNAQAYTVTSGWRLDDGQWRLYYADWKPNL